MRSRLLESFTLMCLFLSTMTIEAQVAIGTPERPVAGALLQLKNIENVTNASANANKGLLLPRVKLISIDRLEPCANTAIESAKHIGLTVYNVTQDLCYGIFVWDGTQWMKHPDKRETNVSSDVNTNTYIVGPQNTLIYSVTKAHDVRQNAAWGGEFASDTPLSTNANDWDVKLLWQEIPDLIETVSITRDIAEPKNSTIEIVTNQTKCLEGNAMVALTVNDEIVWSWHIWVANYNPMDKPFNYTTPNGVANAFMSRNLGALSETPGDSLSIGNVYQWGRKDPFPGRRNWTHTGNETSFGYTTLVDIDNNPIVTNSATAPYGVLRMSGTQTISMATKNPHYFIYGTGNWHAVPSGESVKYDDLWSNSSPEKSIFDPCPTGWRVPRWIGGSNASSPWGGLNQTGGLTWNRGFDLEQSSLPTNRIGYFPASGSRLGSNSSTHTNGQRGFWWSALGIKIVADNKDGAGFMEIASPNLIGTNGQNPDRSHAFSIRCVRQ